jgi:hypothetical protein
MAFPITRADLNVAMPPSRVPEIAAATSTLDAARPALIRRGASNANDNKRNGNWAARDGRGRLARSEGCSSQFIQAEKWPHSVN